MSGVYCAKHPTTNEVLYIGSSIDVAGRERNHRNPNFANHAAFGKFVHANGLAATIVFETLESIQHDDKKTLIRLCRKSEFKWKKSLSSKFCAVFDGLCLQPEEVILKHKMEKREATREHRNAQAREYFKKRTEKQRLGKNANNRASHAKKRLVRDGVVIKSRQMGLTRAEKLANRRKRYAARKLAEGTTIKPRGRTHKPKRSVTRREIQICVVSANQCNDQ